MMKIPKKFLRESGAMAVIAQRHDGRFHFIFNLKPNTVSTLRAFLADAIRELDRNSETPVRPVPNDNEPPVPCA